MSCISQRFVMSMNKVRLRDSGTGIRDGTLGIGNMRTVPATGHNVPQMSSATACPRTMEALI